MHTSWYTGILSPSQHDDDVVITYCTKDPWDGNVELKSGWIFVYTLTVRIISKEELRRT